MKKVFLFITLVFLLIKLTACGDGLRTPSMEQVTATPTQIQASPSPSNITTPSPNIQQGSIGLGDTFQFNGSSGQLEISFGTDVFWGKVENSWSQHYGVAIFAIPVTIRNIDTSTGGLNPFDFIKFAPNGLQLASVGAFFDYDITWESTMRAGASKTGLIHFLYDGDGEYVIEFSAGFGFGDTAEALFYIVKSNSPGIEEFNINLFPPSTFTPLSTQNTATLGESFVFDGSSGIIEITIGSTLEWHTIDNRWSQHYGAEVFSIPISIKNIGTETGGFNPFDITMFGAHGLQLPSVGTSFDNDITWEGSMRPNAIQEGRFFFLYVGDGQYAIEFSSGFGFGDMVEVMFNVER
ncbi:MAG: DUF4352 domain-containing protein [Defluviitaleaceae bacterium]|nr:DUF4352 domain-containing protein [Defluviitaleaceae bacterium]MCL2275790.1 DUF4352 domain-containing protein [Defluviitaleaceae bacterium]